MKPKEELTLEEQVERIRRKRSKGANNPKVRNILNAVFLILAAIGVIWYYADDNNHIPALIVIGISLVIKIIEFYIRFVL